MRKSDILFHFFGLKVTVYQLFLYWFWFNSSCNSWIAHCFKSRNTPLKLQHFTQDFYSKCRQFLLVACDTSSFPLPLILELFSEQLEVNLVVRNRSMHRLIFQLLRSFLEIWVEKRLQWYRLCCQLLKTNTDHSKQRL